MSEQEQLEAAIQASLGPNEAPANDPMENTVLILSDEEMEDDYEAMEDDYTPSVPVLSPQERIGAYTPPPVLTLSRIPPSPRHPRC